MPSTETNPLCKIWAALLRHAKQTSNLELCCCPCKSSSVNWVKFHKVVLAQNMNCWLTLQFVSLLTNSLHLCSHSHICINKSHSKASNSYLVERGYCKVAGSIEGSGFPRLPPFFFAERFMGQQMLENDWYQSCTLISSLCSWERWNLHAFQKCVKLVMSTETDQNLFCK